MYGDIGNKLFDNFKQKFPTDFTNMGVAEANMVTVAAGLAKSGFKPVVYTINSFLYLKSIEQIKLDVCYPNLPVIFVGTGGALSYAELGTTHHSLEDVALLAAIPNLRVFVPADTYELRQAFNYALECNEPTYIRIGKKDELTFVNTNMQHNNEDGYNKVISNAGSKVLVLSAGTIGYNVFKGIKLLEENIVNQVDFWTFYQVKPISEKIVKEMITNYQKLIIIEEHTPYGGLGSIISYNAAKLGSNEVEFHFLNSGDSFHTGIGSLQEARDSLNLSSSSISYQIYDLLK